MDTRTTGFILICTACLLLSAAGSLTLGDFPLSAAQAWQILFNPSGGTGDFVVHELRLPRLICALLAGAALGMGGAIVQSITRNPLGEPSLMGVSSGAAFAMVIGFVLFDFSIPAQLLFGTLGGLLAALLTFAIAWKTHLNPIHLTLAGMSISLFFAAGILVLLVAAHSDTNGIYYWLAGSLAGRTWLHVAQLYPFVLGGLLLGVAFARPLDLLMLDDATSRSLGVPIYTWRLLLGLIAVLLTAATVAVAGPIAFVGLIAPHMVRFTTPASLSNRHRLLLPLSALGGATLVMVADLLAKLQAVPVGILCILLGGPLFVHLIRKQTL